MDRREFLKKSGAVVAGGLLADLGAFEQAPDAAASSDRRPNMLVILVDEMRFPSMFPDGITTSEQFLAQYMPNLFYLWQRGVKFESYYSAGNACSPARATIATGLYPHQQWLLNTRTPGVSPSLQKGFPTYGRLLRNLGYQTPYIGKWHLSNAPANGGTAAISRTTDFRG
ncbi:MAG TPA: sulfatase-like hydrolase/transferase [Solirubrobacteraceae bacterium]|nr:sulfatase-like hydrolase/transferase [Solirubrobacteraceae bacterium]